MSIAMDHSMFRGLFISMLLLGSPAPTPTFDVIRPKGIDFVLENSPTATKYLIETMPGGVALLDYNNDGLLDIFFVNGGKLSSTLPAAESFDRDNPKYWNRLYRQNKDGTFTDVTVAAGLAKAGNGNYGMGVAVGDYDNDGYPDLYVTSYGKNILYHNNGDGTFTDVTQKAGVEAGGWSASAGFFDYDNDGYLDLFVTRYMDWDEAHNKDCGGSYHTYCPPAEFPATTNILYHNNRDGTFTDVSKASGIAAQKARSLGVAFNDYDNDGYADIMVANDAMQEFLFHNNRNGTFTEVALDAGVGLTDNGTPVSGMGVDFRDYDNDGRPDIVITDLAKQVYALFHNDGNGLFSYRSMETGLGTLSSGSSGWGMRLEDFDNDGWKDLFVAQSHVMDNIETVNPSLRYLQPPMLAFNRDGRFEIGNPGTAAPMAGRGAAFGDLKNHGWIDVVETILGSHPLLFMNRGGSAHWLTLSLRGTRSNRDGYGAVVHANGQTQYATAAGSYLSSSDKRVHFGLGAATKADVEISWPSGVRQVLKGVPADRILEVREPEKP
jgi:enediyne biosynthesis protein E4